MTFESPHKPACVCIADVVRWAVALRADTGLPAWSVRLIDEWIRRPTGQRSRAWAESTAAQLEAYRRPLERWPVPAAPLRTNEVYLPAIANALDDRPPSPVQDITPGWFGRWFIRTYIEPSSRGKRARAPRKIAPARQIDPSVLDLFLRSNDVARCLLYGRAADDEFASDLSTFIVRRFSSIGLIFVEHDQPYLLPFPQQ